MAIVFSANVTGNLQGGADGLWKPDNYLTGERHHILSTSMIFMLIRRILQVTYSFGVVSLLVFVIYVAVFLLVSLEPMLL